MHVHELKSAEGAKRKKRIVGRGKGSGRGKTCGRGHTGQKARAGRGILNSLEGGQMPLIRRLPKVGFRSKKPIVYQLVNLDHLSKFKEGSVLDGKTLKEKGLIRNVFKPYKILGQGEIKKSLTVCAYAFSKSAAEKIKKAGGKVQTVNASDFKEKDKDSK